MDNTPVNNGNAKSTNLKPGVNHATVIVVSEEILGVESLVVSFFGDVGGVHVEILQRRLQILGQQTDLSQIRVNGRQLRWEQLNLVDGFH